jgi:gliding motility-associated-like protein
VGFFLFYTVIRQEFTLFNDKLDLSLLFLLYCFIPTYANITLKTKIDAQYYTKAGTMIQGNRVSRLLFSIFLLFILCGNALSVNASHLFGGELYYVHQSGNSYRVYLVLYGDCGGATGAFNGLYTATPQIEVYNGNTLHTTLSLQVQPGNGEDVTPVCPDEISNTTCTNGLLPGVRKFIYADNISLVTPSSNWRFRFTGDFLNNTSAGRSNTLSNIIGSSLMSLEATLNNTTGSNSSPTYTTIPTPFFCMNLPQEYNQGAVDPNLDSLSFSLVPGLNGQTNPSVSVVYVTPYSATQPLGTTPGTFAFNSNTGQLSFTPNITQRSLVVNKVSEYRNGVLVGTSMREMTIVILSNCNNNPPDGGITNPGNGTVVNPNTIHVCTGQSPATFTINPTDPDGDNITLSVAGMPAGATHTITANGTPNPVFNFSWNTTAVAPGTYTFFLTLTDDGCPLISKQTAAFTVVVLPKPSFAYNLIQPATCTAKGIFTVTPSGSPGSYSLNVTQGTNNVLTVNNISGTATDSLLPGTYTFRITAANGCYKDSVITIAPPASIQALVAWTSPSCSGGNNGSITAGGTGGSAPYQFAFNSGPYGSTNTLNNLAAGAYFLQVKDANGCTKDTTVVITDSFRINLQAVVAAPLCNGGSNGSVTLNGSGLTAPYTYAVGTGSYSAANTFNGLGAGTYTFHVRDIKNCQKDTTITVTQPVALLSAVSATNVLCNGGNSGSITVTGSGGTPGYNYALNNGPFGTAGFFNNLASGTYVVHTRDNNNCLKRDTVIVTQPTVLNIQALSLVPPSCNGGNNGSVSIGGSGGNAPYTFALNAGAFSVTNTFSNLAAGTYTLRVRDANNCTKDSIIQLIAPAAIHPAANVTASLCSPVNNGSVTLSATGGIAPYQFALGGGAYSPSPGFTGLAGGTYTFSIKDANNCVKDTSITITNTVTVQATVATTGACFNQSNGSLTITPSGGLIPYSFAIGAGAYGSTNTYNNLPAANYILHIKDANNCIKDTTVTIVQTTQIMPVINATMPACNGSSNGSISVTASGGTPGYTYAFGNGPFGPGNTLPNIPAGSYVIHIKDAFNCTRDTTFTLAEPSALAFTLNISNVPCHGTSGGSVSVNPAGGTPAYTFAADNNPYQAGSTLNNLAAGSHVIRLKDNNNCTKDSTVILTEPPAIHFGITAITMPTCEGFTDASITLSASGGVAPYQFAKGSSGAFSSSPSFNQISEGTFQFRIRDANGCIHDTLITFTGYPHIVIDNIDMVRPLCYGQSNGSIQVNASGGLPPFSYRLADAGNWLVNPVFSGISARAYVINIKDNNGCIKDTTVTLSQPDLLTIDTSIVNNDCNGTDDGGIIDVVAAGGTQPYSFSWLQFPSVTEPHVKGLPNGKYDVKVKDANGCADSATISILYNNCCQPFIPNAFTPNGDGQNDDFNVLYKGDMELKELSIYNRYGQRVFSSANKNSSWDGTFNGKAIDGGIYFYYIRITCGNITKKPLEFKGDLVLVR